MKITAPEPQSVIFEVIDADAVSTAAKNIDGSGGPTHIDSDGWKHILCSKSYGSSSRRLCQAIADLAKSFSSKPADPNTLQEFVACRLVPLNKGDDKGGNIGVRPIGIGEVLHRIVGKVVTSGCIEK